MCLLTSRHQTNESTFKVDTYFQEKVLPTGRRTDHANVTKPTSTKIIVKVNEPAIINVH